MTNKQNNYEIIAKVIEYISLNPKHKHSLEQLADFTGLTATKIQKTFTDWCGVSPKQFQRFLSLEHAKKLLNENKNILQASTISGLSSQGRLHDLFVDIEAMTPGEYKNGGQNLTINYSVYESQFGFYLIASTTKGICNILFLDDPKDAQSELQSRWLNAQLIESQTDSHIPVVQFFAHQDPPSKIKLNLHGTNYQLKVWEALLKIPESKITTYGDIAKFMGDNSGLAARAVGTAIGNNPIGYLIPCHRVLQSTGAISGYRWGVDRKRAILGYEASKSND
jgi:AraC family transcriptional regulator, regulatory protein of adaptative response / methylated-DNA-[protein]-cysteine methyltransferase